MAWLPVFWIFNVHMVTDACSCTQGAVWTLKECQHWKLIPGEKILCSNRELNPWQYCTWYFCLMFYQLTCSTPKDVCLSVSVTYIRYRELNPWQYCTRYFCLMFYQLTCSTPKDVCLSVSVTYIRYRHNEHQTCKSTPLHMTQPLLHNSAGKTGRKYSWHKEVNASNFTVPHRCKWNLSSDVI